MRKFWENKKLVAWGRSKLLILHLEHHSIKFEYCIDENVAQPFPIKVISPHEADLQDKVVVIFAVSNAGLNAIRKKLTNRGLVYGTDFIFCSDLYQDEMLKLGESIGFSIKDNHHLFSKSFTLNSIKPVHTTMTGNAILLAIADTILTRKSPVIAEVGSYEGGNVYAMMSYLVAKNAKVKKYFVFDSFEGFPDLTEHDPSTQFKGSYKTNKTFQEIKNDFDIFEDVEVIKGFVPETFKLIDENIKFDLVFYDCDLYQPALDTLNYFWDRMSPGGYIVLHDYVYEPGGFAGVQKATAKFLADKDVLPIVFWPSTMAVIKK